MSFLDPTDIASAAGTSTPPQHTGDQQSLNEEVNEVIGQLGRFWGGFRKQGQAAFETARKEAQKQLTTLTSPTAESSRDGESESEQTAHTPTERDPQQPPAQTIFARLQSALPPNIVNAVQDNLPESVKHASENGIDFAQLRSNLSTEFQRVQGLTRTQAEEYVHKSEALLRETFKEAQEVLRDAVKVVPPEGDTGSQQMVWDGADVWMLPSESGSTISSVKGKGKETLPTLDSQHAVATRAEALLRRLKHDSSIIKHDPEADQAVKEMYTQWLTSEVDDKDGGIDGKLWTDNIESTLKESMDGPALQETHDSLVPSEMSNEVFWKRYFFRVHQIQREEEKRKALLAGSVEGEDDFSWEDDEDDPNSAVPKSASSSRTQTRTDLDSTAKSSPDSSEKASSQPGKSSATTSPRESSEESYDLVSSGNVSAAGDAKKEGKNESDEDSDWE